MRQAYCAASLRARLEQASERRKYHKRELHESVQAQKTTLAGAIARRLKINGAADQHDTGARMSAFMLSSVVHKNLGSVLSHGAARRAGETAEGEETLVEKRTRPACT